MEAELVRRLTASVMGTEATVVTVGPADPAPAIDRLHQLEQRWSRFRPDSDISRLNRAGGAPLVVHRDTFALITAMVTAWYRSRGAFDPTLLGPLVKLGYHTSRTDPGQRTELPDGTAPGDPASILIDPATSVVQLPVGMALDPGGIGKGLAADIVVAELMATGAEGALVEVGGDLRVSGRAPDIRGWMIAVADRKPNRRSTSQGAGAQGDIDRGDEARGYVDQGEARGHVGRGDEARGYEDPGYEDHGGEESLVVAEGGVATSTTRLRRWMVEGVERHHLLDPSTASSSRSPVDTCTVLAGTGALAETYTKVAFARSPSDAVALFNRLGLAARLALGDGSLLFSEPWSRFAWSPVSAEPIPGGTGGRRS